jgi:hypothetical protein
MGSYYRIILSHLLRSAGESSDEHREENVSMTHGTLGNAGDAAGEIIDMIRQLPEDMDLEPWVVSKITIAEDYLDTVRDYLSQRLGQNTKSAGCSKKTSSSKRAKLEEVDSFTACGHFLPALINGDYSGLEAGEERSLRRLEKSLISQHGGGPLNYVVNDEEPEFARCGVTGLMGDVVTVKVYADVSGSKKTSSRKKISAVEKLEIGSAPHAEKCEQLGPNYDERKARIEINAFRDQLIRMFGQPPAGASFFISRNYHDFGTYLELGVKYNEDNEKAEAYAFKLEGGAPEHWDAEAKAELAREMAKLD